CEEMVCAKETGIPSLKSAPKRSRRQRTVRQLNRESSRVMGIDPGWTRCGWPVAQAGRGRAIIPISVGVARTPPEEDLAKRLLRLSTAVEEWMDDYKPDVVAIERLFERGNVSTVLHTAHGVGVLMLAAAKRD